MTLSNENKLGFFNEKFPDNRVEGTTITKQAQLVMLRTLKIIDYICHKHNIQYWLEGGTLLGAIRHQGFIPWDDDLDISMLRADYNRFIAIAPQELPEDLFLQLAGKDQGFYNLAAPLKIRDCNSHFTELHEHGNEQYHTGIYIDIFPIDVMSETKIVRNWNKWLAKKIRRVICAGYSEIPVGSGYKLYKKLGLLFSSRWLQSRVDHIIKTQNIQPSQYLGFGYDSVQHAVFNRDIIFPLATAKFEDAQFPIPARAHELLTQFYGDYMTPPSLKDREKAHAKKIIPILIR